MVNKNNQRGLGRGLSALLADAELDQVEVQSSNKTTESLPIEFLEPNPDQPRKNFDEDDMEELATSIGERGVIQPILVRKLSDERYQIVAGERRWRAAGKARLHKVPVIIREYSDNEVAEIALIENIQRTDLNAVEEALAYQDLIDRYNNTQDELAKTLGKSRSHIANMLRILRLETQVQDFLRTGEISFGHARALVTSDNQIQDAKRVISEGLSVRELERLLEDRRSYSEDKEAKIETKSVSNLGKDADTLQLEQELSANIGSKVKIDHGVNGSGKLTLKYKNLEQLDRICQLLGK